MVVRDNLKNYTQQAQALLRKFGDQWMWSSAECEGELTYWLMYADNKYDPTKGAKEGTWRIFIAKCRISTMRRMKLKHSKTPCFTDIGEDYAHQVESLESADPLLALAHKIDEPDLKEMRDRCALTEKQLAVFDLLSQGYTQVEIAEMLGVSKQAIGMRNKAMLDKLRSCFARARSR
jgi:DNA-binding XRE family transcriptional regulator